MIDHVSFVGYIQLSFSAAFEFEIIMRGFRPLVDDFEEYLLAAELNGVVGGR